jgi:hypothetical protein
VGNVDQFYLILIASRDFVLQTVVQEMKKRCSGVNINQFWSWIVFLNTIVILRKLHSHHLNLMFSPSVNLPSTCTPGKGSTHCIDQQKCGPKTENLAKSSAVHQSIKFPSAL